MPLVGSCLDRLSPPVKVNDVHGKIQAKAALVRIHFKPAWMSWFQQAVVVYIGRELMNWERILEFQDGSHWIIFIKIF